MRELLVVGVLVVAACGCGGSGATGTSSGGPGGSSGSAGATSAAGDSSGTSGARRTSAGTAASSSGSSAGPETGVSSTGTAASTSSGSGTPSGTGAASTTTGGASTGTTGGSPCSGEGSPCFDGDAGGLCCGGACIDPSTDPANCNGCGNACTTAAPVCAAIDGAVLCLTPNCDGAPLSTPCAGNAGATNDSESCTPIGDGYSVCAASSCAGLATSAPCIDGDGGVGTCCGTCADPQTDPGNCGECGGVCPTGAICAYGYCSVSCQTAGCPAGLVCILSQVTSWYDCQDLPPTCDGSNAACAFDAGVAGTCCGASCADTQADPANCGGCGKTCSATQFCASGACTARADCASGPAGASCRLSGGAVGLCCNGSCVVNSTAGDPLNCGSCGAACPLGATCAGGGCIGDAGFGIPCTACPAGEACGPEELCYATVCSAANATDPCLLDAGALGACCGDACTPLGTDQSCASCGDACAVGSFCLGSACIAAPDCATSPAGTQCPIGGGVGECCGGTCTDGTADPQNCGGCSVACAVGAHCQQGSCNATEDDGGRVSGTCGPAADAGCPAGTACAGGATCLPACTGAKSGAACGLGATSGLCCSGACVDAQSDPGNCLACGHACPSGICLGQLAATAYLWDTEGCYLEDAGPQTDCDQSLGVGCPAGDACVGDLCVPAGCTGFESGCLMQPLGLGLCCSSAFSETCVNLENDPQNCGGCDVVCPQGQTCTGGLCSDAEAQCGRGSQGLLCTLAGGSGACCGGACVDPVTDDANCGGCSNDCVTGGWPPGSTCIAGQCKVTSCSADGDGVACVYDAGLGAAAAGQCCSQACIDVTGDPSNCGACATVCVGGETCRASACGFDACTGEAGNPCHFDAGGTLGAGECCAAGCLDTADDPQNCGGCGLACPVGAGCVGGHCSSG